MTVRDLPAFQDLPRFRSWDEARELGLGATGYVQWTRGGALTMSGGFSDLVLRPARVKWVEKGSILVEVHGTRNVEISTNLSGFRLSPDERSRITKEVAEARKEQAEAPGDDRHRH